MRDGAAHFILALYFISRAAGELLYYSAYVAMTILGANARSNVYSVVAALVWQAMYCTHSSLRSTWWTSLCGAIAAPAVIA